MARGTKLRKGDVEGQLSLPLIGLGALRMCVLRF